MPKISVIVPVYNVEKYLNRCIDSILNQTFTDFELILVDDGSPDNSSKICDEYAIKDSRVKVIHKKNGGVSSARNAGLDNALGEYVSFIDADDWVEKDTLELLLHETIENRLDVCSCGFIHEYVNLKVDYQLDSFSLNFNEFLEDIINIKGNDAIISTLVNKIYLKKIIDDNNIRLLENLSFGEDNVFVLTYYKYVKRVGAINNLLYHYDCSVEGSAMKKIHLNANDSINKIDKQLKEVYSINEIDFNTQEFYFNFIRRKWTYIFNDLLLSNICLSDRVRIVKTWIPTIPSLMEAEIKKYNTSVALFINKLFNEGLVDDIIIKGIKSYKKKENRIALKNKIKISIKRIFFRRKK